VEIFKGKETEAILQDEDEAVEEEDFPTYSQDSQEYMHWHYRLNHPTHTVMIKMAKQNMLPRRITKIRVDMGKQHTKYNQRHIKKATYPGEVISVNQLESSIPGFLDK
jgi:hypothetical protein